MYDLVLRGGTVIDGSGRPRQQGDVAVQGGRVAAVGRVDETGRREIDVTGHVVSPGIIDVHTHYDAQLFWDPAATPSCFHGVTTVIGGNCGFTLAPYEGDDYLLRLMARVEGIPLSALQSGPKWDWTTFADYLDRLDGHTALNAGFLFGHSSVRRSVMGNAATERAATVDERDAMVALLHQALDAGALGLSSSDSVNHNDGYGVPVPSRFADRDEAIALAAAVAQHRGTTLEWITSGSLTSFSPQETQLLTDLSLAANRPLNWNALGVVSSDPMAHWEKLKVGTAAADAGASVLALALPVAVQTRLSFLDGFILDGFPGWNDILKLPAEERLRALSDDTVRAKLRQGSTDPAAGILRDLVNWRDVVVGETFTDQTHRFETMTGAEIASATGARDGLDAILDIVVADQLRTGLDTPPMGNDDLTWQMRAETWNDPRVIIGGSDAGAHVDIMCGAITSSVHLGPNVRDRNLLPLEQAVRQLTDVPARLYGLRGRGRVAPGFHADLMVFDPTTIGPETVRTTNDMPGGGKRLYAGAIGVPWVFVNGTPIVAEGALTGDTPGTLLRSGRDTYTVEAGTFAN